MNMVEEMPYKYLCAVPIYTRVLHVSSKHAAPVYRCFFFFSFCELVNKEWIRNLTRILSQCIVSVYTHKRCYVYFYLSHLRGASEIKSVPYAGAMC